MWELEEQVRWMVEQYIEDASAVRVSADAVGLDIRAGFVFVSTEEEWIATSNTRSLEYYGGFEYVDQKDRTILGKYTFYDDGSDRVDECIDYYAEHYID